MNRFVRGFATARNPFSKLFQQQPTTFKVASLQPGKHDEPLQITLTEGQIGETSYECLSYDRTEDGSTTTVNVDGQSQSIPKHLESGLRTLRSTNQPRILWADHLVGGNVQQQSSQQASIVREILHNADSTLCWTGPGNDKTTKTYNTVKEMANRWNQACAQHGVTENWTTAATSQMQGVLDKLRSDPFDELDSGGMEFWKEIWSVFSSPYWNSIQTIPAIILAKKAMIVCGQSSMPWADFSAAAMALSPLHGKVFNGLPLPPGVMKGIEKIVHTKTSERRRRHGETLELLPMIMSARNLKPKDPRECVFAMLPIVDPSARREHHNVKPQLPEIDYTKTVQEVFINAARYIVLERQDLFLWFYERQPSARRIKGLPSWVPDFTRGSDSNQLLSPYNGLRHWSDSLGIQNPIQITDDNLLQVKAHLLDSIKYVSPLFNAVNYRRLALDEWSKLGKTEDQTVEERDEAFWRTLLCDNFGFGANMNTFAQLPPEFGEAFQSLMAEEEIFIKLGVNSIEELAEPQVLARVDRNDSRTQELFKRVGKSGPYADLMMQSTLGRRFFVTEAGLFGLTAVENFAMVNDPNLTNNEEEAEADGTGPKGMAEIMSNPLARDMLAAFQAHMRGKDPEQAKIVAKLIKGELPYQQEELKQEQSLGARAGDVVVVCAGGFCPYILRSQSAVSEEAESSDPESSSDDIFEYVSDCYVHGAMDGEFFKGKTEDGQDAWVTDMSMVVNIQLK